MRRGRPPKAASAQAPPAYAPSPDDRFCEDCKHVRWRTQGQRVGVCYRTIGWDRLDLLNIQKPVPQPLGMLCETERTQGACGPAAIHWERKTA